MVRDVAAALVRSGGVLNRITDAIAVERQIKG
jgi:hypothetical protein